MVAPFADPPPLAAPCVLCHSKDLSKVHNCEGGIPPSKQAAGMSTSRSRRSTLKDGRLTCRNSNPLATCSSSTLGVGPLRFHRPVVCRCHSSILHGDESSGSNAAEMAAHCCPHGKVDARAALHSQRIGAVALGVGPLRFHRPVACRCHSSIFHGDASSGSIAAEKTAAPCCLHGKVDVRTALHSQRVGAVAQHARLRSLLSSASRRCTPSCCGGQQVNVTVTCLSYHDECSASAPRGTS